MITEEQFAALVNKVAAGEGLDNQEATDLIQAAANLDQRGFVMESTLEFVLQSAEYVYNGIAEDVAKQLQLRDHAKSKKITAIGRKGSEQLFAITQMYMAQLYQEVQEDAASKSAVADANPDVLFDEDPA